MRYIHELNNEEKVKVLNKNTRLEYDVIQEMIDDRMMDVSDELYYFKDSLEDFEYGVNSNCYIKAKDYSEFIGGLESLQDDMGFFNVDDVGYLTNSREKIDSYLNEHFDYNVILERQDDVIEVVGELEDKVAEIIKTRLHDYLNEKYREEYFLEVYIEDKVKRDWYIDSEYIMYENINYVKSYA